MAIFPRVLLPSTTFFTHMLTLLRLKSVANVIHFWDFISAALVEIGEKYHEPVDLEAVRKTMHWLVTDKDRVWFAVVVEDSQPVAFAVVHDATPPFEPERVWAVRWFYHAKGHFQATLFLKNYFDIFAKESRIGKYLITTNHMTGGAIRCFQSERFGLKKAYLVYECKV